MAATSLVVQAMAARAHEASSLAVSFWNTSLDPQLLPLQHIVSKTVDAYSRVQPPYWEQILSSVLRLWNLYVPRALEMLGAASPPFLISVPLLLLSTPILAHVVYQLYFHPLAKYPGPLWGRLSGSRAAYHAWRGDLHHDMWECHQKYGPYIRYQPNYLLFDTTQACKDIYGHNKNMQKSAPYLAMVHHTPSTFTIRSKNEHAWKKRILSQRFSDAAIRSYEPEVLKLLGRFCDAICPEPQEKTTVIDRLICEAFGHKTGEKNTAATAQTTSSWSEPFNMATWCDNLFFDLMTTTVFGECFDLLRSQWYRYIPEAIARSNQRISVIVQWPVIVWRRLDKKLFKDSVHGRKEFLRFVHNLVTDRLTRGPRPDVFSGLLTASDPATGNKLSRDEIVAESILMIVAGSDTSSTLLSSMFFYLARNSDKKARLVKEIRSRFATREEVRFGPKLNSCRYLHACISECLRMAPPVASSPFREVTAGGAVVDNHYIPEGMNVGTGIYSIQHNESYFPHPFEFLPERWLEEENSCGVNVTEAQVPFSIGPRACLGKALAVAEGSLAMAYVCWTMDFGMDESKRHVGGGSVNAKGGRHRPQEYQLYDHITSARQGPWIRFKRRNVEC